MSMQERGDDGKTTLIWASYFGNTDTVARLLNGGANLGEIIATNVGILKKYFL